MKKADFLWLVRASKKPWRVFVSGKHNVFAVYLRAKEFPKALPDGTRLIHSGTQCLVKWCPKTPKLTSRTLAYRAKDRYERWLKDGLE